MIKKYCKSVRNILSFIKIDFSFLLIFVVAFIIGELELYFVTIVFLILHEMSHLFVAFRLGYLPRQIHLNFFGASLEGFDDFFARDEVKIVVAGPLFNLFVVVVCYLLFWFYPESYEYINIILLANKSILIFNLLPIFPLDAGRLVLSFLSMRFDRNKAVKVTKNISLVIILFLFVLFLISIFFTFNFSFGFVCVNLCILLFESYSGTSYKREIFIERKMKYLSKGIPEKCVYVKSGTPYYVLLKKIDNSSICKFKFLNDKMETVEIVSEVEVIKKLGLY